MPMLPAAPAPSSALAFLTTVHAALAVLRLHRGQGAAGYLRASVALAFTAMPWVLATPAWLVTGLATHIAWFAACERFAPVEAQAVAPAGTPPTGLAAGSRPSRRIDHAPDGGPRRGGGAARWMEVPVLVSYAECEGVRTIRVARPPGFAFRAGQFLPVKVHVDGRDEIRCYSISSAPEVGGYLEVSVRRQGLVSGVLHSIGGPGARLAVTAPGGQFCYPDGDDRPLVLVAGGIGITPLISMLRHAVVDEPTRPVTLLYSARTQAEIAFADEISLLARRHPQVRVVVTLTAAGASHLYRRGRIDATLVREVVADPAGSIFLMCGPQPMLEALGDALVGMGVPGPQVRFETFAAAAAAGARVPAGTEGGTARVRLDASGLEVDARAGETLLDAAERSGASIPTMCRAGSCGTCRTRLISGRVGGPCDALDADDRRDGYVLPCVNWPESDCVLEA